MFDKIKQVNELRKMRNEALSLQKELKTITESIEERNIKVIVTADQRVSYLSIDGESQPLVVEIINKALKEVQKKAAKKMMEKSGGLSSLLGKM